MSHRPVKSALRVLEILKLFADEKIALSQTDIFRKLNIPQSSSNFLLRTMVEAGYLTYYRQTRLYLPTPEVLHLGKWLEGFGYDSFFSESVINELIEDLGTLTGETISITSQNDIFVHFHRVRVRNLSSNLHVTEGTVLPLTHSSYGRILLSRQSDKQIDRVCRLIRARDTVSTRRFDVRKMVAEITKLRSQQFCYCPSPLLPGAGSVATTLPVAIAGRDVAIGVGGPMERIEGNLPTIIKTMRAMLDKHGAALAAVFGKNDGESELAPRSARMAGLRLVSEPR